MRPWTAVVLLAVVAPVRAEEDLSVLKGGPSSPRTMLRAYLLAEAEKHFDARRAAVAALKTPDDLQKRQQRLKAHFREALGDWPEKTPLKPRTVGTIRGAGFTIEKVIYESRPDHHVTANLYLPAGKGPFPGVLMPMGHSNNGKAASSAQQCGVLLAKNGLALLAYDPIGQGERRQLLTSAGKPVLGNSTSEHTMTGVGALLVGRNTASYRVWDGVRSLDYLCSRPEIDAKRLGVHRLLRRRDAHLLPDGPGRPHRRRRPRLLHHLAGTAVCHPRPARRRTEHHRAGGFWHGARRLPDHARSPGDAGLLLHPGLLRHPGDVDQLPRGQAPVRPGRPRRSH